MSHDYEHTVVYSDIVALYVFYWPLHQNQPERAQRTTGDSILSEMTASLRAVVSINRGVVAQISCKNASSPAPGDRYTWG